MITISILILTFAWFAAPYCLMGIKFGNFIQSTIINPKKKITIATLQKQATEEIPIEEVEAYILTYMLTIAIHKLEKINALISKFLFIFCTTKLLFTKLLLNYMFIIY